MNHDEIREELGNWTTTVKLCLFCIISILGFIVVIKWMLQLLN